MRKLLVLLGIFITTLYSAQITRGYGQKYTKKTSKPSKSLSISGNESKDEAKKFAEQIAKANGRYIFLQEKISESDNDLVFRYIPSSIQNNTAYINKPCKECLDIRFRKNQDLKNYNTDTYAFSHIWGDFADLFPIWKALFKSDAQKSDYEVSDQNVLVEWKISYGNNLITFGRLGTAWYINMK